MAKPARGRWTLADLVAAILVCGLIAAFYANVSHGDPAPLLPPAIGIIAVWFALRQMRTQPRCIECGARFQPSNKRQGPLIRCPVCDAKQTAFLRGLRRYTLMFWSIPVLMAPCFVLAVFVSVRPGPILPGLGLPRQAEQALWWLPFLCLFALLAVVDRRRARFRQAQNRTCEACGAPVRPDPAEQTTCENCRFRKLSPERASQAYARNERRLLPLLVVIIGVAILLYLVMPKKPNREAPAPQASSPVVMILAFAPVLAIGGWLFLQIRKGRKIRALLREGDLAAAAEKAAGEPGRPIADWPAESWYSGAIDPGPLLREARETTRVRLEQLLAAEAIDPPAPRVLAFHDTNALFRYLGLLIPGYNLEEFTGLYLQRPWRVMLLTIGQAPALLATPRANAVSVWELVMLEEILPAMPQPWIQVGISLYLREFDRECLPALTRRAALMVRSGTSWPESFFTASARSLGKLSKPPRSADSLIRLESYHDQAASIVHFLAGPEASAQGRARFVEFLKDPLARTSQEECFFNRFGHGFGSLLDAWKEWVLAQPTDEFPNPAEEIRKGLRERVLPCLWDHGRPLAQRRLALGDWRRAGALIGGDVIIELLRSPGDMPTAELLWALRSVAGVDLGADPVRWQDWWNQNQTAGDKPA